MLNDLHPPDDEFSGPQFLMRKCKVTVVDYASELIRFESTSSLSNGPVTDYAESVLQNLGCETERIEYQDNGVLKANVIGRFGTGSGG